MTEERIGLVARVMLASLVADLVIPASRIRLLGYFAGGLGFVAFGVFLIVDAKRYDFFEIIIGLVTVAFFGAIAVTAFYRFVTAAPAIIINARRIVDTASGVSVGLIPWDHIGEVREYRVQNQVFLGIEPKDLEALLAKQPRWKRAAIRANLSMGAAPVNIPQGALGMKVSDLVREIEQRRPHQSPAVRQERRIDSCPPPHQPTSAPR